MILMLSYLLRIISGQPTTYRCPAEDKAGFDLGHTDYSYNAQAFFCAYPNDPSKPESQEFYCLYDKSTGHISEDSDAGKSDSSLFQKIVNIKVRIK